MTEYCLVTRGTPNDLHQQQFMARNQGPLSPGCEVRIACLTTGVSLGPDLDGEICVRGCKLFAGYYNNPSATAQAFDRDGWYRTGDIGHYDTQHCLYITDRIKDAIRVSAGGNLRNVSPVEVEQHLLTHPMVREAVVVGVTNTQGPDIQWPRAYVVPTQPGIDTADEIQEFVSGTLSYLKQLKAGVVFVDQIRRTVIGKVDRKYYKDLVRHELIE
ncbi:unnamed protein product [Medioppia subpectinata]|uniref:AMP-binding enzyme C-terminal domain-containing protein n=1 Tax=Medioppia subpectinata TaxID=1979941 RepID=A0A7R9KY75_9ACAR|nr:unnamed protein product [Medioppia subpectinata]CAG2112051.1 unnamed protein product [Medioppia subpectinata]